MTRQTTYAFSPSLSREEIWKKYNCEYKCIRLIIFPPPRLKYFQMWNLLISYFMKFNLALRVLISIVQYFLQYLFVYNFWRQFGTADYFHWSAYLLDFSKSALWVHTKKATIDHTSMKEICPFRYDDKKVLVSHMFGCWLIIT